MTTHCVLSMALGGYDLYTERDFKVAEHSFGSCEYMSFGKLWQEKGCSSQAETWQVKNIYTDERF